MLAACSQQKGEASVLTIEPLILKDKEKVLINKTGVNFIEYFKLNGHLEKNEDLKIELVKYVNGKNTGETISSSNETKVSFKDEILSFGIQTLQEGKELNLLLGIPDGLSSNVQPINSATMTSYGNVLNKKIKLIKDTPVYLAAWMGTSKSQLSGGLENEEGKFPSAFKDSELAFVYKITLIDRKK